LNYASPAAGDTVYIDDGHNESVLFGASIGYGIKGFTTKNNPIKIICVDKATDTLSVGAVIHDEQTSATFLTIFSNYGYSYGVQYKSDTTIQVTGHWIIETSAGNKIISIANSKYFGTPTGYQPSVVLKGDIEFEGASAALVAAGPFLWKGGTLIASAGATLLITSAASYTTPFEIRDVDLSAMGNNTIFNCAATAPYFSITLKRCKMPATFTALAGTLQGYDSSKVRLHHCSSANKSYDFYEESYCGSSQDEVTLVRTGGASDGTTPISIKMVSSANTKEQIIWLEGPSINSWTDATVSTTFTIEVLHDSATALQDDDIWMELEYPANNTDGLGAVASSRCAILGTPADIPDSSETWTTTGLTNPNTRKLTVTVTPGKKGPITARVYLAKASTTCYIDPKITES
jgi:hypothetical protein